LNIIYNINVISSTYIILSVILLILSGIYTIHVLRLNIFLSKNDNTGLLHFLILIIRNPTFILLIFIVSILNIGFKYIFLYIFNYSFSLEYFHLYYSILFSLWLPSSFISYSVINLYKKYFFHKDEDNTSFLNTINLSTFFKYAVCVIGGFFFKYLFLFFLQEFVLNRIKGNLPNIQYINRVGLQSRFFIKNLRLFGVIPFVA